MLKGITVQLHVKVQTGTDAFHAPVYEDGVIDVENVLVAPTSSSDLAQELYIDGKRVEYQLAIPKGDKHQWYDTVVEFFGEKWRTIGYPQEGIEAMLPLDWNKKVSVERYG